MINCFPPSHVQTNAIRTTEANKEAPAHRSNIQKHMTVSKSKKRQEKLRLTNIVVLARTDPVTEVRQLE